MSRWFGVIFLIINFVWIAMVAPDFTVMDLVVMFLLLLFSLLAISGAFEGE